MVVAVVLLLVSAGSVPVVGVGVAVGSTTVSGPAVIAGGDRPTIAGWRTLDVTASVQTGTATYDVCIGVTGSGAPTELGCQRLRGTNSTTNVTVSVDGLPTNVTGDRELLVTVRPSGTSPSSDPLTRSRRPIRVLTAAGDADDDGLANRRELQLGTDFDVPDTDGDGLADGPEVNTYETDPTNTDTDGDGLADGVEVSDLGTNPTNTDTDDDGLTDGVEVTTHGTDPTSTDTDGDGLTDGAEVDEYQTDPTEADTDGDGLEDGPEVNVHETDPTSPDTDGDGLSDAAEVNRYGTNPTETDTDGDGLADGREVNQYGTDPTRADTDGDGQSDGEEVQGGGDPSGGASDLLGPSGVGTPLLVAVFVGVSLLVGAAFAYRRRRTVLSTLRETVRPRTDAPEAGDALADEAPSPDTTGGSDDVATLAADAMTDEERVHRLVADRGGRIRQAAIVEETGWSKSKVSRVLSRMAEDGEIEKITLGRENLITLPDEVPDGAASPFESTDSE